MPAQFPDKNRHAKVPGASPNVDASELADCLEFARAALESSGGLPAETRRELEHSLDYAETVLRRAAAEDTISVRIKSLFSES